ncbi:MAG: 30S ribosomal protein S6 [Chloroflexota bacterium]|nr:30S ribosomal protein S6 [Chloroflexota bacterium]
MRDYELVALLNPTLSQEGASASWERIKRQITDKGGQIVREDRWGTRRLAYTLSRASQRFSEGNFFFARFNLEPKGSVELEANLKLAEDVLRFLVVKAEGPLPPPKFAPQPALVATPVAAATPVVAATPAPAPAEAAAPPEAPEEAEPASQPPSA